MDTEKARIASVALTLLVVTSVLPAGIVGFSGTAAANDHGDSAWYTLRQPGTGVCHEVQSFTADHDKMVPEVVVRGTNTVGDVTGPYRDEDWNGPETIESIMDYRYRHYPNGSIHAVGQTEYYAPYLNEQYRREGWSYGTYGLWNWSDNGDSHLFFYQNSRGEVSLVIRHDRMNDETGISSHRPYNGIYGNITGDGFFEDSPGGGTATWTFSNLPRGEWAYIDDMYPREDMDDYYTDGVVRYGHREAEYESEPLREFSGGDFYIEWFWAGGGTDGGAYRGFQNLAPGQSVTINASFTNIDEWEARSNDGTLNGEMKDFDPSGNLVIQRGRHCPDVTLDVSPDSHSELNETVTFVADADAAVATYHWDFDGDGEPDRTTSDATVPYTFNSTDNRTVSVIIEATNGGRDRATQEVTVSPNEPPVARLSVEPGEKGLDEYHVVGETVIFNARNSTDNTALRDTLQWQFGDNSSGTGDSRVGHTYTETGTYEVTVEVRDTAGNNDTVTRTIEIVREDNATPTVRAELIPAKVEAGATFALEANASDDNRGIVSYEWDLDGDSTTDKRGKRVTHAFGSQSIYNVTLTVTDGAGNRNATTVPVEVIEQQPPNVTDLSVPERVTAGEEFTLDATTSDNGRIVEYQWVISGEVMATTETATHTFTDVTRTDTKQVQLIVTDATGEQTVSAERNVTVLPPDRTPPNANLTVSETETRVGDTVTLNASASTDPPHRDITAYHWNFDGDNATDNTTQKPVVTHAFEETGTYNATVRVEDGSGNVENATVQITVEQKQQAQRDSSSEGSVNTGPPPTFKTVGKRGESGAVVDVQNGRDDETVYAPLPENVAVNETGVRFDTFAVNLGSNDAHVVFQTEASAEAPESVPALTASDRTLAYLDVGAKYLDGEVENATVGFTVQKSELGKFARGSDVSVYQYNGSWERLNATVVDETGDTYRLKATTDGPGTLAVGATPSLSVTEAGLDAGTVTAGGSVTATATVENIGPTSRSVTLNLTFDGSVVTSKTVEVPAGGTEQVSLSADAGEPGTYEVTVGGVSAGTLTVEAQKAASPADVAVADVSLNASTISTGEQVEITAAVENTGGKAGERTVALTMFGEQLASKTVEVPAGETKTVTFVRRVDAPGTYEVKVDGTAATLEVTDDGQSDDDSSPAPNVPGFGVGAALVALLAAALLARYRG